MMGCSLVDTRSGNGILRCTGGQIFEEFVPCGLIFFERNRGSSRIRLCDTACDQRSQFVGGQRPAIVVVFPFTFLIASEIGRGWVTGLPFLRFPAPPDAMVGEVATIFVKQGVANFTNFGFLRWPLEHRQRLGDVVGFAAPERGQCLIPIGFGRAVCGRRMAARRIDALVEPLEHGKAEAVVEEMFLPDDHPVPDDLFDIAFERAAKEGIGQPVAGKPQGRFPSLGEQRMPPPLGIGSSAALAGGIASFEDDAGLRQRLKEFRHRLPGPAVVADGRRWMTDRFM